MSIETRHARNRHGDPVLTITITGWHDIFRTSWNFCHDQVEFVDKGSKALQWMRRSLGAKKYDAFDKSMTGGKSKRWSIRPRGASW